ncbi:MAG: peptide ABC transporter substrate-binding protein [Candidatus Aminicenantaceae bacterium]
MKGRYLIVMNICFMMLAGIQCRQAEELSSNGESKITVLYPGDEYFLNPFGGSAADHLVFLPLFVHDENGELQPKLAERWEHSPDYRIWTIHIRRDIKWHDGAPVTAHDVKFSMELWAHPDVGMSTHGETITVLDDFTFKVGYKKPSRNILDAWQVFYPKHLLENLDSKEVQNWEFWTHPVGNGPYRYVRHVPKTMMVFEVDSDYPLGKPRIERVVIKFGGSSELTELLSGNVDAVAYIEIMDILKLKGDPRFTVYHMIYPQLLIAIHWNHRHPFFCDPVVRRALTLAINRRELYEVLNIPETVPVFDVTFSERQFRRGELPEPLPFNRKLASHLLEEAGWQDSDADGIREKDGEEFRFSMLVSDRTLMDEKPAVYIQEQLRRVGVRMEITSFDFLLLHHRYITDEFDAAIYIFNNFPGLTWHYSSIGYDNPRIAYLHKSAGITMDLDKLDNIYLELMAIHKEDIPLTFLYPNVYGFIARKFIRGLSTPFHADPILSIEHLWIEDKD